MLELKKNYDDMRTVYKTDKLSSGTSWYPGSNKFWVKFSSDVSVEIAGHKNYKNYIVWLFRRCYTFEDKEFFEYQFEYWVKTDKSAQKVSREFITRTLDYKKDFSNLINE